VHTAMSQGVVEGIGASESTSVVFRKSLFFANDLQAGSVLSEADIKVCRPGYGLPSSLLPELIGRQICADVARGTPLTADYLLGA
jgi:sialic acid synthase SpsE